ncbi:MAG: TonB-dependent receptor plug domain-containing protein [Haliscomenobacter sp.]|nr:TonB-dependent receptor plug domain-containing protein [Haliscomenobacter sp.]
MRHYILFFIILFQASPLIAQNAIQISGKIQEAQSKHAVPYATVLINGQAVYAGEDGTFKAEIPAATQYRVVVEQIGFEPLIQILDQLPSESLTFSMHPRPVWVSEILVAGQRSPGFAQSTLLNDDAKLSSQPRDVGDLLNDMPGFAMIKRGGYALDPVFRSFKYEQLNVVYDGGVELTHACPNRMDPATTHVNPEEIRKIELIRGPFSVRYGPSMGATINIVTETPFQESADGFGGSLEGGYEFNGNGKSTRLTLNHQKGNYRFFAAGGLKDYGSYSNGDGKEIPTSFRTYDYTLKGGLQAAPDHQIHLTWRQGFVRDVLHAGLMMDTDYDNTSMAIADYNGGPWALPCTR